MFWRSSPNEKLKEYVITVLMFGLSSSAYNAVRTVNQCAKDYQNEFPKAAETITKCFYMDDGVFGCDTVEEAKILCKEVEFVLNQGNFTLKSWSSNAKELEAYMCSDPGGITILTPEDSEEKLLGLGWLKSSDELSNIVKPLNTKSKITKRNILSDIPRLHDPNGFIAPIIIRAKMLMQSIWQLGKMDWDDEVPEFIKKEWLEITTHLHLLSKYKLKRWTATKKKTKVQIHAFCDASEKAYGTVIYVRAPNEHGNIVCSLLSAKSRVAPLKDQLSIPRLELLAAVMASEQLEAIVEACEFNAESVTLWSDSLVVLHWIKKQPLDLKAFVSNRVKIIQQKTKRFE